MQMQSTRQNERQNARGRPQGTSADAPVVLVVDDEADIVEALVELLEDEGYTCRSACNARHAMELVHADPAIGVVVTDIRMPGMDGLEMARQLKATAAPLRDLFVIVVTGHAGMKEAVEALKLGAEDFLTKPISPDHLLHSVRRAAEMIQLRQHERSFQQQLTVEVKIKTAELNEANGKLLEANQIKDQFLSVMGHELRTPLNAIIGFAELLKVKLKDASDPAVPEYLEHIFESGTRLSETIENILEFSAAISGNRRAHTQVQILEDVLDNVVGHFDKQAADKSVTLQLAPLAHDQMANVDSTMLMKALECLVDNAIKFSVPNTTVTIGVNSSPEAVGIFVQDQGCGMNAKEIEVALLPLSQVDSKLTRLSEGVGVGLSLAKLLSELQGGCLDIQSVPNQGTTATIVIPQSCDADKQ